MGHVKIFRQRAWGGAPFIPHFGGAEKTYPPPTAFGGW